MIYSDLLIRISIEMIFNLLIIDHAGYDIEKLVVYFVGYDVVSYVVSFRISKVYIFLFL